MLATLIQDYPKLERSLLEAGKLRPRAIITLNGQTLDPATGLEQYGNLYSNLLDIRAKQLTRL
jgi:hypothetical protein